MTYLTPQALADHLEATTDLYYGLDAGFGSAVLFGKRYAVLFDRDERTWTLAEEVPFSLVDQYCAGQSTAEQFDYLGSLANILATRAFQQSVLVRRMRQAPNPQAALAVIFESTANALSDCNVRAGYIGSLADLPAHIDGMSEFNYANDMCVFYELTNDGRSFRITAKVDSIVRAAIETQPEFAQIRPFFAEKSLDITQLVGQILREQDELEAANGERTYAGLADFAERWLSSQIERLQSALSASHIPNQTRHI